MTKASQEARGRNFAFVQKVENLPENWREIVKSKLIPMAYVVHDKDVDIETGELVDAHVHFFAYFSGKRAASGVAAMFAEFGIGYVERIECKNAYLAYMLHINEENKHRYGYDEMVIVNGLKVNFADLTNVSFADVLDFAQEKGITRFNSLVRATKEIDPPLFRYISGHYALVCAYFSDVREEQSERGC